MKYLIILISPLLFISCYDGDYFEIPINEEQGEYQYVSQSDYFDIKGDNYQSSVNQGIILYNPNQQAIQMTPLLGWEYYLQLSDVTEHTLTDGSVVFSFRIRLQNKVVSDNTFNVFGTNDIELVDGGTLIGSYDGLIFDEGSVEFGIESINISSTERAVTYIQGNQID
ncbi:MAG: hypothetical protein OCD76_08700 [Reichenbachiella sp.]